MHPFTLIHTNDVHCNLDRWPGVAAVIKAEMARAATAGSHALYVDAGDFMEMSDQDCYGTRGELAPLLLGALGCAAFVPGNNELWRNQLSRTTALAEGSAFPWLCCNLRRSTGEVLPGFRDWTILNAGPIRIGVVGCTAPYYHMAVPMGLTHTGRTESIRRAAAEARRAGAGPVILLSHMGLRVDREMAAANLGINLIIGGHTHDALAEPEVVAGVSIVQAGLSGEYVGVVQMETDGRQILSARGRLVPTEGAAPDPEAVRLVAEVRARAAAALDEVVTDLPAPLAPGRVCAAAAEALRRFVGAEIGLTAGVVAVQGLPAGPVTRRDLLEAIPSLFAPALLEGTGAALLTLLEESHWPEYASRPAAAAGQRSAGVPIGPVHGAGLTYSYVPQGRNGRRVVDLRINGEPAEFHRVYRIGAPSFMAFPKAGYPAFAGFREVRTFAPELVREVLEAAFRNGLTLTDY